LFSAPDALFDVPFDVVAAEFCVVSDSELVVDSLAVTWGETTGGTRCK
jgi:hypothetical protein